MALEVYTGGHQGEGEAYSMGISSKMKRQNFISSLSLPEFSLWKKPGQQLFSFDLEITPRCNNSCRHCYINLPANDASAKKKELSLSRIKEIARQAVDLGALWCLVTGGEPLLREDFSDIYLYLKKKGLLVSVFTNATLINEKHVDLFKKYPPRDIDVTVYGVTEKTYEKVTQRRGSFKAFTRGLNLLLDNGIKAHFKAVAMRSNFHELPQIFEFCREKTPDYFRFDPFFNLRLDGNPARNEEIKSERLSPEEIVAIERADAERFGALEKNCGHLTDYGANHGTCNHIFHCGAGNVNFGVSYDGYFRLCSSLCHPDCIYDLKKGTLKDAWEKFVPAVQNMRSDRIEFLTKCHVCPIIDLCMWCPAHAHLETGRMDAPAEYFCSVANKRREALAHK